VTCKFCCRSRKESQRCC